MRLAASPHHEPRARTCSGRSGLCLHRLPNRLRPTRCSTSTTSPSSPSSPASGANHAHYTVTPGLCCQMAKRYDDGTGKCAVTLDIPIRAMIGTTCIARTVRRVAAHLFVTVGLHPGCQRGCYVGIAGCYLTLYRERNSLTLAATHVRSATDNVSGIAILLRHATV